MRITSWRPLSGSTGGRRDVVTTAMASLSRRRKAKSKYERRFRVDPVPIVKHDQNRPLFRRRRDEVEHGHAETKRVTVRSRRFAQEGLEGRSITGRNPLNKAAQGTSLRSGPSPAKGSIRLRHNRSPPERSHQRPTAPTKLMLSCPTRVRPQPRAVTHYRQAHGQDKCELAGTQAHDQVTAWPRTARPPRGHRAPLVRFHNSSDRRAPLSGAAGR